MTAVIPANTTVEGIRTEVREYVGISSASILPNSVIDQEINYFYTANIPESIKMDQLRTVYTFYTLPFVDRYPVDVNLYQSFRDPVFVDGLRAKFYKDRSLFYSYWPNVRTYIQPAFGDGVTTSFSFNVGGSPIVRTTFMASCPDTTGFQLICADDGGGQSVQGNLLQVFRNSVGNMTPPFPALSPLPPDPLPSPPYTNQVGTINYATGSVNINWPTAPASGEAIRVNYFNPSFGRPNSLLYWNNEIVIRPVPKFSHKITLEAYQNPSAFLLSTEHPFLNNFKNYIALGVAIKLLMKMGDTARRAELDPDFMAAEGRVLERQGNEEIGQANATLFNQNPPYFIQYPYGGYWN